MLKKSHYHLLLDTGRMSRYRFIATERNHYPMRRLCQVLSVLVSGLYAWPARPAADHGAANARVGNSISEGLWCPQMPLRHPAATSHPAPKRKPSAPLAPTHGPVPPWLARAAAQGLHPAHDELDPRPALPPPTGCSTNLSPPRPIGCRSWTSRIYRSPTAPGPIYVPSRAWPARTCWADTWRPPCPKNWSPPPCSGSFWPNRLPQS